MILIRVTKECFNKRIKHVCGVVGKVKLLSVLTLSDAFGV